MKFSYVVLIAAVIFCSSCEKTRVAPNGFKCQVLREGTGEYAQPGQFLVMNMLYRDAKDSIWADTKKRGIPLIIPVGDTSMIKNEKGIESTFRILKKNDSVLITMEAKLLFDGQPMPPNLKPEEKFTFLFGVIDITDRDGVQKLQEQIQAKEMDKARAAQAGQVAADTVAIDAYLADKNIIAQKGQSGLRYVITQQGSGDKPSLESTVKVNYKGSLLADGSIFDQSESPIEFPLSNLIQGWQIGFQLLPKGSKATLYIPSTLGYGANGAPPNIPPNANLVFEVELIDFK
ncbi:MAG: FKBP-type peptidyl-prolyl cis-trans isomerase [Bacteroidota bacterium]